MRRRGEGLRWAMSSVAVIREDITGLREVLERFAGLPEQLTFVQQSALRTPPTPHPQGPPDPRPGGFEGGTGCPGVDGGGALLNAHKGHAAAGRERRAQARRPVGWPVWCKQFDSSMIW